MESILFWGAVTLYALSTALFFVWVAFRKETAGSWGRFTAAAGLLPHFGAIFLRWKDAGHGPFSTQYEVLSANAFLLVVLFLLSTVFAPGLRALGAFIMPAVFLLMGLGVATFGVKHEVPIIFRSYWLYLHIGFAKAWGASVLMASACAVAYLVRDRRPRALERLPSSGKLDLYSHQFLLVAFLFLGVMIVAGSLWAHQSWGRYWAWDPIETSALGTWIAFGIILHFRILHGWNGRRMAWLTLVALSLTVVTLYVVVLITPTIHNFYMVGRP